MVSMEDRKPETNKDLKFYIIKSDDYSELKYLLCTTSINYSYNNTNTTIYTNFSNNK